MRQRRKPMSRVKDRRGRPRDRFISKLRLLVAFGDGVKCQCVHCGCELKLANLTRDRIVPDGPYRLENLQPSCLQCNVARGNDVTWVGPAPTGVVPNWEAHINPLYMDRVHLHPDLL
jgi:hypothetical protein